LLFWKLIDGYTVLLEYLYTPFDPAVPPACRPVIGAMPPARLVK